MVVIVNNSLFFYDNPIETRDIKYIYRTNWRLKWPPWPISKIRPRSALRIANRHVTANFQGKKRTFKGRKAV